MSATEVPLTKSQKQHLANLERRDANRKRTNKRLELRAERDRKIKEVNQAYLPKIAKLRDDMRTELKHIWDEWKELVSKGYDDSE